MGLKGGCYYQKGFIAGKRGFAGSEVGVDGGTDGNWLSTAHTAHPPGMKLCLHRQGAGCILPLKQVTPSPIQPGLVHFQGCDSMILCKQLLELHLHRNPRASD